MRGDRYGEVIKITKGKGEGGLMRAHVKLDVSGKTMRFIFDDCTVVDEQPLP
jgi:hypothetical protein